MEFLYTKHEGYDTSDTASGTIFKNSNKITEEEISQLKLNDEG